MPTIPTYEGNYVAPGQTPGIQYSAPSAAQIDAGVSGALGKAAEATKQMYIQVSQTRAEDAGNNYTEDVQKRTKLFEQLKGADAANQKNVEQYNNDLQALREKHVASIKDNDLATREFSKYADKIDIRSRTQALDHSYKEGEVLNVEVKQKKSVLELQEFIRTNGADESAAKEAFFSAKRVQLGESVDPKELEAQWNMTKGVALAQIGNNILNTGGPNGIALASKFYEDNKDAMDPDKGAALKRVIDATSKAEVHQAEAFNLASTLDIKSADYETKRLDLVKQAKSYETTMALNNLLNVYDGERKAYVNDVAGSLVNSFNPADLMNGWSSEQTQAYDGLPEQVKTAINAKMESLRKPDNKVFAEQLEKVSADIYSDISKTLENGDYELAQAAFKSNGLIMSKKQYEAASTKIANFKFFKEAQVKRIVMSSIADIPYKNNAEYKDMVKDLATKIETDAIDFASGAGLLTEKNSRDAKAKLIAHIYDYRNLLRKDPRFSSRDIPETTYTPEFAPAVDTPEYEKYKADRNARPGSREQMRAIAAEQAWVSEGLEFIPAKPTEKPVVGQTPTDTTPSSDHWDKSYFATPFGFSSVFNAP